MNLGAVKHIALIATVATVALAGPADARRRTFTFESDTTYEVSGQVWLDVDNTVGDITLFTGATNKIKIRRLVRIAASDSTHAAEFLDDVDVRYHHSADGVRIKAWIREPRHYGSIFDELISGSGPRRQHVDFEIEVPEACDVRIQATSGDLDMSGVQGRHEIEVTSGDLYLEEIQGQLEITATSGDIRILRTHADITIEVSSGDITVKRNEGSLSITATSGDITIRDLQGNLNTQTSSGDQELFGVTGSVQARATSGNINCTSEGGDVHVRVSSGDANIESKIPPDGVCEVVSTSGDITLGLAENPGAVIEIDTRSGDIDDEMDIDWRRNGRRHRSGTFGAGRADVHIETSSGDIRLKEIR